MLTVDLRCTKCGNTFPMSVTHYHAFNFPQIPKFCPACKDQEQGRPDIVLSRETMFEIICRVDESVARLLSHAEEFCPQDGDKPSRRIVVKGQEYGADWHGRIDLWTQVWPIGPDMIVRLCHNLTRRQVWVREEERVIGSMTTACCHVKTYRRVSRPTSDTPVDPLITCREEENEYVVLLPQTDLPEDNPVIPSLVWAEAHSKTTLKGYGRQFESHFEGSPIWYLMVHGGVRSARLGTEARLAVVNPDDPLRIVTTGDAAGVVCYPHSTPSKTTGI